MNPKYGLVPAFFSLVLMACGGSGGPSHGAEVGALDILPGAPTLVAGSSVAFQSYAAGTAATGVTWTASGCSITASGLFTASPCAAGTYTVTASVQGVTGSTTVRIVAPGTPQALYAAASSACAAMPVRAAGTTTYFCDCQAGAQPGCVPGDDAAAGTSPAAPKRTFDAARAAFNAMAAGGTVAFCRGGAFSGTGGTWANTRCAPGADLGDPANASACDIRDYTPAWGGPRPILLASGGYGLPFNRETSSTRGVRILNLDVRGPGTGPFGTDGGGVGFFTYGPQTDFYVCGNLFDGWNIAYQGQTAGSTDPANHTFLGNWVTNSYAQAVLARGHNLRIDANYFANNGSNNNRNHTLYISSIATPPALNGSVVNNEIHAPAGCLGNPVIIHGNWSGFAIQNNLIDSGPSPGAGCWALSVENDSGFPNSGFLNFNISRNRLTGNGNHLLLASAAPNVVIENNVLALSNMPVSEGAITVSWAAAYPGDLVTNHATVRNNTIYFSGAASSSSSVGIRVGVEGTGHVIANNAIYFAGGAGTCFSTPLAGSSYTFVGDNACFNGTWGTTLDATTRLTADPRFASAPLDVTPRTDSPLVGAGNGAYSATLDFLLKTRPSPPTIGAYEP